jgi:polyisoprenyl-teichoic acid--peptidoglycan teichoic acid transferase
MSSVTGTWRAMSAKSRIIAVVGVVAVLVIGSLGAAFGLSAITTPPASAAVDDGIADPTAVPPGTSLPPLPPEPSPSPGASPVPSPSVEPGSNRLLGSDGRFTILLLGSDYRPAHPGNRTDAIMVVSLDPATGKVAAFSVPRDTSYFPLPGGGTFAAKVNGLYQHLLVSTSNGNAAMKNAVGKAFNIEIDDMAFIGFAGVRQLINAIGGVDVTLDHAYYDPEYWVNSHHQGWGLPAGTSHLNGDRALIFARSRKGDNDFERTRRQQLLVMAALEKVRHLGPDRLPALLRVAASTVRTDLPLAQAVALFQLIATADLDHAKRAVFGPRAYAESTGGTSFRLKLNVARAWIVANFPKARPNATWPPAPSPSPSPSTTTP